MAYQWLLVITPKAQTQVDEIPRADRTLMFNKLIELLNANDPTDQAEVTDIKKLKAPEYRGLWRKRAGNWRILYRVEPGEVIHLSFPYHGNLIVEQVVNRRDL